MAEELLDRPQVRAALEQVRRVGMAQTVGVSNEPAQHARVEAPPAHREKERIARTTREGGTAVAQPGADAPRRLLADGHETLLVALSANVDVLPVEIDVAQIERHGLGRPKTARVHELEQRGVAERQGPLGAADDVDRVLDLPERGCLRKAPRAPRSKCRVGHALGPEGVPCERPDRRQPSRDGRGGEPVARAAELGGVRREHPDVEVVEIEALPAEPTREVPEVGRVGAAGRVRRAPGSRETGPPRRPCPRLPFLGRPRDACPMRLSLALVLATAIAVAVYGVTRHGDRADAHEGAGAVTLVGDSLNVGIEPYLADELRGWRIDAHDRVGRATPEGIDELRRLRGALAPVVVVSLGTNDPDGSEAAFRKLVDEAITIVGPGRCLVWATIVRDGRGRAGFDRILRDAESGNPNVRLVEWTRLVESDPALLADDAVHGTPDGYAQRAGATARAVRDCPGP